MLLIVIDKPAGLAVHGGSGVSHGVVEQLRAARPHAPFLELVHRLDRDTSGVLMLAKRRSALLALHRQLREGRVQKFYLVLVTGPLARSEAQRPAAARQVRARVGRAARCRERRGQPRAYGLPAAPGVAGLEPPGSGAEDRPDASDPGAPRSPRVSHCRRRQVRRLRAQQGACARRA